MKGTRPTPGVRSTPGVRPTPAVRRIERAGATIAYRRTGDGPPLVLLHATLSSAAQLAPLVERLASRWTVLAIDRRGSSACPVRDPGAVSMADHVADVEAVLAAEGLGPAVIVGHSFGGCVALELAARRPALVRAVLAWEPPYAPVGPPVVREMMRALAVAVEDSHRGAGPAAAAELFLRLVAGERALAALSPGGRARLGQEGDSALADAMLTAAPGGLEPAGLGRIACPVLLAGGTASMPFYREILDGLAGRIPGARRVVLDELDHTAPITRPDQLVALVDELAGALVRHTRLVGPRVSSRARR